jgi:N-acyl-D-amino-acid deacylase
VQDVPGDGSRYVRDSLGVDTVIVAGGVAWSAAEGYSEDARGATLPYAIPSDRKRLAA